MTNKKIIAFDMDGTLADLYGVEGWLPMLRSEDPTPYAMAKPLVDMEKLNEVCALLQKAGWEIQIITALSKGASPEYKKAIREAKKAWLEKWGFIYDKFHGVDYKTPKCEVIRKDMGDVTIKLARMIHGAIGYEDMPEAILVDDEARHTDRWGWGRTINPTENDLISALLELLPEELEEG